ncbi:TetR/AcrR family transcriptional regulator [Psychroflexus sp. CAK8W]|uniref:TetR/AcrR family transcriptional regulator n=1 Tax=Psychroflexus longus TaxID=2873596 RepID=A0ABS7XFQ3_9FLAO|nr:TetR/AcrR family transcriptional regulator [Psychroflexus longus]MBZ9777339.1 TetR/AcrR family transcriptional regulator [Psychroflexus longus]
MTRRQEIIKFAKTLFRERGYKSVSMRDLAKVMDFKAASLYNHISSKEEILAEIALGVAQYFTDEMELVKQIDADSKTRLEAVINHHIDITLQNPEAIAIVNNDWVHLEGEHYQTFLKLRNAYEEDLRKIISEGVENGELKSKNVEVIMFSLLSTLRTLHSWYRKRSGIDGQQLKNEITQILLYGVIK